MKKFPLLNFLCLTAIFFMAVAATFPMPEDSSKTVRADHLALEESTFVGKTLPDVSIKTLDGKSKNIKEYGENGKITILSFWATWCSPCKRELDAISEIYEDWQDEFDVELVAITIDNSRALPKVKPMVAQKGWEFEILADSKQELQRALNFQVIPQTFVVNQAGEIVYQHEGYTPGDEFELEDKIKKMAAK